MHIHLIGVAGTGMGAFAGLLRAAGHRVTGSDTAFYPPMGDALARYGVETLQGWDPAHLDPAPDLVVVGNVCRKDNPEARAAIDRGLPYRSFPKALGELFLASRRALVVAGTHGKTTTTALTAWLLHAAGLDPSFLVGGVTKNFDTSFALGRGGAFVVEGDEYDSAFFEKIPKFWSYRPWAAILTSVEHDHIDIYPSAESYRDAFVGFASRLAPDGVLVAHGADPEVRAVAARASCRVVHYGLSTDVYPDGFSPTWMAAPIAPSNGMQPFELFIGGSCAGRFFSPLMGEHNLRNTLASIALLAESFDVPVPTLTKHLRDFKGVKRRQELVATAGGVRIYDDFAHHPTAVYETLRAMRGHLPGARLFAVFEPRSATACRSLHQNDYPAAFAPAHRTLLAPVGRAEIPEAERLDVPRIVADIRAAGGSAETFEPGAGSVDQIVARIAEEARPGDSVAVLSNGAFGGIHAKLAAALTARAAAESPSAPEA
jgi:UDP-N-acetylmuramate: L-alanyl-gamma-D-glutamyl-meso-diaminopimelate ligase